MLQWMDGFAYTTVGAELPYETKYDLHDSNIGPAYGRNGGSGFQSAVYLYGPNFLIKSLFGNHNTFWQGKAVRIDAMGSVGACFMGLQDAGTMQVSYRFDVVGHLLAVRGDPGGTPTPLCISATTYSPGTFHYIEAKTVINSATGSIQIWVDGVKVASASSVNTQVSGNATANQEYIGMSLNSIGAGYPGVSICDMYCLDTTGAAPWNNRLGDCTVVTQVPSGPGSFAQFTPSQGQNYQNVDTIPPGANYNSGSAVGQRDSFAFPGLPSTDTIYAVMPMPYAGNSAAGSRSVAATARQGSTDKILPNVSLGVGSVYALASSTGTGALNNNIVETDVNGLAWTPTNFNATQFGYEVTV